MRVLAILLLLAGPLHAQLTPEQAAKLKTSQQALVDASAAKLKADLAALVDSFTTKPEPMPTPTPEPIPGGSRLVIPPGAKVTISDRRDYPDGVEVRGELVLKDGADLRVGKELAFIGPSRFVAIGQYRTPWIRAEGNLAKGQTVIGLWQVPEGWKVNDTLCISDTRQLATTGNYVSQTEEVKITSIDGAKVTVEPPLQFSHSGSLGNVNDDAPIVDNLTRSIRVQSIDPLANRAHAIVMLDENKLGPVEHTVCNVEWLYFGRTTIAPLGSGNLIGQYGWHAHLIGDAGKVCKFMSNVVIGYPAAAWLTVGPETPVRWGIAVHGTQGATVSFNVCLRYGGAGIVTEDAAARGNTIHDNHVMDIRGNGARDDSNQAQLQPGSAGAGYYLAGLDNSFRNNIASSCVNGSGFTLFGGNVADLANKVTDFVGNESYCCRTAIAAWYIQADSSRYSLANTHTNWIDDFRAWHIHENAYLGYPVHRLWLRRMKVRGAYAAFNALDYLHADCGILDPDWQGVVSGGQAPMICGHESVEARTTLKTFTLKGGKIEASAGGFSIETPNGPSTGGALPRRTLIDGTKFGATPIHIGLSYVSASIHARSPDRIEVLNYDGKAGDNFGVYWPHLTPPCTETRPKIRNGYVCPLQPGL